MYKLIIPLLCLLFSLYCEAHAQIAPHRIESYKEPWRVVFYLLDGSHIKHGMMNASWKTRQECLTSIPHVIELSKQGLIPPLVGIECKRDGIEI